MRSHFFPCLILLLFLTSLADSTSAQFLITGKSSYSSGQLIAKSDSGSIFVSGNVVCSMVAGNDTININNCDSSTTNAQLNFYTLKIDQTNEVNWIRHSSITNSTSGYILRGLSADDYNNTYLAGTFKENVPVDSMVLNTSSKQDAFIVKRKWNGEVDWILNEFAIEDSSECTINGIKKDTANTNVIYGSFLGKCAFGNDTINSTREQLFIARVYENKTCSLIAYGKAYGDSSKSTVNEIEIKNGEIFTALHTEDSVVLYSQDSITMLSPAHMEFDYNPQTDTIIQCDTTTIDSIIYDPFFPHDPIDTVQVDSVGCDTILNDTVYIDTSYVNSTFSYLAKLKNDTIFEEIDRGFFPNAKQIVTDSSSDHYLLSNFSDSCIIQNDTLQALGNTEFVLAKYLNNGDSSWLKSSSGGIPEANISATSATCDEQNHIYLAGNYGDSIRKVAFEFAGQTIDSSQQKDGFLIKVSPDGTIDWMQRSGGGSEDTMDDLIALDSINVIGTGLFSEYIEFGTLNDSNFYGVNNLYVGTIDPYPDFDITINPNTTVHICNKDSLLFSVTEDPLYEYQWQRNDTIIPGATGSTIYAKEAGTYSVLVTNTELPYTRKSRPVQLIVDPIPTFTIWTKDDTTFCEGEKATLKTESQSEHTYRWYRDGSFTGHTDYSIDAYSSGDYAVQVTSDAGCDSTSRTIDITALPYPSAEITPADTSFCEADSLELQAPEGYKFEYRWFRDDTELPDDTLSSYMVKEAGIYSVIVSNRIGCATPSGDYTYSTIPSPEAILSFIGDSILCEGDSTMLSANTGLDFTYTWYKDNIEIPGENDFYLVVKEPGVYTVDVGYLGSCSRRSNPKEVTVYSNPETPIQCEGDSSICDGHSTILSTPFQSGNSYQWYRNGIMISGASSHQYEVTQSGDYKVIETNPNGCSQSSPYQRIIVRPSPDAQLFHASDSIFCEGDSVRLYTYDFPNYHYSWQKNGQWIAGTHNHDFIAKHTGEYHVLVEDMESNCAASSDTMSVIEVEAPAEEIQADQSLPICENDTVNLSVTDNELWAYQWYRDGYEIYGETTPTNAASEAGSYTVEITNENGCIGYTSPLNLELKPNPTPPVTVNDLYISTKSYNTLHWNYNGNPLSNATEPVYLVEQSGEYSVTVYYDNGCIGTSDPVVVCNPLPTITIDENLLTASEGSSYQWYYEGDTISGATQQQYTVQMTGFYSVDVTHQGCTSRSEEVEVCIPVPTITILEQNVLEASAGQSYQWYKGDTIITGADARMYEVKKSGFYKAEVESYDGCISFTKPVEVYINNDTIDEPVNIEKNNTLIKIYPNPVHSVLNIDISKLEYNKAQLKLIDLTGRVRMQKTIPQHKGKIRIHVGDLYKRIYLLEIKTEDKIYRKQIVKI